MIRFVLMVGCVGFLALFGVVPPSAAAPVPKDKPRSTAQKLHGDWKLVKSPGLEEGTTATVSFKPDGTLKLKIATTDGGSFEMAGKFTAEGEKISYELQSNNGARKEVLTIKKLTEEELITVDPDDKVEEFKRSR